MSTASELETGPVVVYQFHVLLLEISPAIWRRLLLRSDATVADLHYALQIVMGWDDTHLHRFVLHGNEYDIAQPGGIGFDHDPTQLTLADWHLRPKERFLYEYDLTSAWRLQLRLEQVLSLDPDKVYPLCLAGARHAPPEYCCGPWDFMTQRQQHSTWNVELRLVEIFMLLQDQQADLETVRPQLQQLRDWLQADKFDRQVVNRCLQSYAAGEDDWYWPE